MYFVDDVHQNAIFVIFVITHIYGRGRWGTYSLSLTYDYVVVVRGTKFIEYES